MTNTKRTIAINEEYRLLPEPDNVQIERLVTIDPTKSPNFDPDKHDAALRQEWRSVGKYYSTISKALTGLLEYKLHHGEATSLREIQAEIREFKAFVERELGAEVVAE